MILHQQLSNPNPNLEDQPRWAEEQLLDQIGVVHQLHIPMTITKITYQIALTHQIHGSVLRGIKGFQAVRVE